MARVKRSKQRLSHLDSRGRAKMVDVLAKPVTSRTAVAEAVIRMQPKTLALITRGKAAKGDVLAVARIAGIQAAKRTHELIPLCHPLSLSSIAVAFEPKAAGQLRVTATANCEGKTGVEMEALTAAAVASLTVYDMIKAVERGVEITRVRLLTKSGGRSGPWKAK